jgi:hypothetical protein
MKWLVGLAIVVLVVASRRRGASPEPATAPQEGRSPQRLVEVCYGAPAPSNHYRSLSLVVLGVVVSWLGVQLIPPAYNVPTQPTHGSVEVFISDPAVEMTLDVSVFDETGDLPRETKMVLWMSSAREQIVDWAVVLSGTARYASNDPYDGTTVIDGLLLGARMKPIGDLQVWEGRATVGPSTWTNRYMDWHDEAVGPYFWRSASWAGYGSKNAVVLPAFGGATHLAVAQSTSESRLHPVTDLGVHVGLYVSPPGQFLRIDASDPQGRLVELNASESEATTGVVGLGPITQLIWSTERGFPNGIRLLYSDVAAEASESSRSIAAGVLLGLGGSTLISGLGLAIGAMSARRTPKVGGQT